MTVPLLLFPNHQNAVNFQWEPRKWGTAYTLARESSCDMAVVAVKGQKKEKDGVMCTAALPSRKVTLRVFLYSNLE